MQKTFFQTTLVISEYLNKFHVSPRSQLTSGKRDAMFGVAYLCHIAITIRTPCLQGLKHVGLKEQEPCQSSALFAGTGGYGAGGRRGTATTISTRTGATTGRGRPAGPRTRYKYHAVAYRIPRYFTWHVAVKDRIPRYFSLNDAVADRIPFYFTWHDAVADRIPYYFT